MEAGEFPSASYPEGQSLGQPMEVGRVTWSARDRPARPSMSARRSQGPMEVGRAYSGTDAVMSATTSARHTTAVGGEGIAATPTVMASSEPKRLGGKRVHAETVPRPGRVSSEPSRAGAAVISGYRESADQMSEPTVSSASADMNSGAPGRKSLPTIKLGAYDGTTPLETFLAKMENCAEYYG